MSPIIAKRKECAGRDLAAMTTRIANGPTSGQQ
jgi:hypothetical protein